jgi:hypothetical protein
VGIEHQAPLADFVHSDMKSPVSTFRIAFGIEGQQPVSHAGVGDG